MSVYFAQREELIKIGWSSNVPDRIMALKAKLIGAVPGNRTAETVLHLRFAHLRVHGEWFKADEDLLAYIRNEAQDHIPDHKDMQTAFRLPEAALIRADELAERMTQPGRRCTRSEVIRVAIFKGLDVLENEEEKKR